MAIAEISYGRLSVFCFFLLVFSLFLTSYSARNPWIVNMGSVLLGEIAHPIQRGARGISSAVENTWSGYVALRQVAQDNENLRQRLSMLEADNSRLREVEQEVERLRSLVQGAAEAGVTGIGADVIGYDPSNWIQAVTVNRGSEDGVVRGMAAVQGNFLVGKVIGVGRQTSQILLLLDPTSGVDALVQSTRVRGIVAGNGKSGAIFQYISPQETVKTGDRIITSGMDGVFPKGLVIGVVSEVNKSAGSLFQKINVAPSVRFRRLETVLLVSGNPAASSEMAKEATVK